MTTERRVARPLYGNLLNALIGTGSIISTERVLDFLNAHIGRFTPANSTLSLPGWPISGWANSEQCAGGLRVTNKLSQARYAREEAVHHTIIDKPDSSTAFATSSRVEMRRAALLT